MKEIPFNDIAPYKEVRPTAPEPQLDRRTFLKIGTAAAALCGIGFGKKILTHHFTSEEDAPKDLISKESPAPTQEQVTIAKEDSSIIGKTFTEQAKTQDHITLDTATKKALYANWRERYDPGGPEYEDGLLAGLMRMRPWIQDIKKCFQDEDIPEEYMYLAIAESHFRTDARSKRGAIGPYQFMEEIATKPIIGLTVTKSYDERLDPILSAGACARHLRNSYKQFGNDWELATMDYNGGFTNLYHKEILAKEKTVPIEIKGLHTVKDKDTISGIARAYNTSTTLVMRANNFSQDNVRNLSIGSTVLIPQDREVPTLDGFNTWLENRINTQIEKELSEPDYVVKNGDTMSTIARKFDIDLNTLLAINNLTMQSVIHEGDEISIPSAQKNRTHIVLDKLDKYKENINYPEKFYAIRDVISELNLSDIFENAQREYKSISIPKEIPVEISHKIQKGDTITRISDAAIAHLKDRYPKFNRSKAFVKNALIHQNNIDGDRIFAGQELTLRIPIQKPATLTDIAAKYQISFEVLRNLNPAIKNPRAPLPKDIPIRIPT